MALHPLKLPRSAAHLFRVVRLQKQLLQALAEPGLDASQVNVAWVQNVWSRLDAGWVKKYCRGIDTSVLVPLRKIAGANPAARQALYEEFRRQHHVRKRWLGDGAFRDITALGFNAAQTKAVASWFGLSYALLGIKTAIDWRGYQLSGGQTISKDSYKADFRAANPPGQVFRAAKPLFNVCPYCDGELGDAELDHYLAKDLFPLLACSPWNLVPACRDCNNAGEAKGNRPALTLGPPRSTAAWLHPFSRPATAAVQIKLSGRPQASIPQLYSPDPVEQERLKNHHRLMDRLEQANPRRSLSKRWTNTAAAYYDRLVSNFDRRRAVYTAEQYVEVALMDHEYARGKDAFSLVKAAVCRAVINRRPGYAEEFADSNPVGLA